MMLDTVRDPRFLLLLALAAFGGGLVVAGFANGCLYVVGIALGGTKATAAVMPYLVQGMVYGAIGLVLLVASLRLPVARAR